MNTFEQALLKYYNKEQLKKVQSIKIGIGGAGGLGSNAAMLLVRSGFRDIEIIDHDKIELSNLNRQQYFLKDVGSNKVDVLKNHLLDINPDLSIITFDEKWSEKNASRFFKNRDIVIECFDKAEDKCAFVKYYKNMVKFVISGNGMAGLNINKPLIKREIGNVIIIGDGETAVNDGNPPMAPRVSICASMMAETILNLALTGF